MCENMRGLKVKKRTDRHRVQSKLRPLFVNNKAGRSEHVALQNSWSPAVGSGVCIKEGSRAAHLPPQPSARGRKSAFSLDPWRELNTKLNRGNVDAEVGCYSAKPPSPLSRSTDTAASPSAIARTDGRMPLPDSAAHTHTHTHTHTPGYQRQTPGVFYGWGRRISQRGRVCRRLLFAVVR